MIIRLRDGSIQPRIVVDVKRIAELDDDIREDDGGLTIGARTTMTDIAADQRIRRDFQALAEAAAVVGSVQIRNRATLAGNICNASPAADTAPALLVYGAIVVVTGPAGTRRIPIDDAFVRSGVTTLARGELVTAVELPRPVEPRGSVHVRTNPATRPRPGVGHAGLRGDDGWGDSTGIRQPRPAADPGFRRDRLACRSRSARRRQDAAPRRPLRRCQPVGNLDARQPRVPPGDAARARAPGGRDGYRAPGQSIGAGVMTRQRIELTVNGRGRSIEVAPHHTLLDVLRDDLGLTGTKECCLVGECGACTVLVDDVAVDSCLMLGVEADGTTVTTVEGLATGDRLHPLQQAFLDTGAAQCGFCIPGQLLAAKALLADVPQPSRAEVEEGLAGNLCRCAGYEQIIEAVLLAAEVGPAGSAAAGDGRGASGPRATNP